VTARRAATVAHRGALIPFAGHSDSGPNAKSACASCPWLVRSLVCVSSGYARCKPASRRQRASFLPCRRHPRHDWLRCGRHHMHDDRDHHHRSHPLSLLSHIPRHHHHQHRPLRPQTVCHWRRRRRPRRRRRRYRPHRRRALRPCSRHPRRSLRRRRWQWSIGSTFGTAALCSAAVP